MEGEMKVYALEFIKEIQPTGVFASSSQASEAAQQTGGHAQGDLYINFNANNGNSLYSGSTLQVNALQTLVCIKI